MKNVIRINLIPGIRSKIFWDKIKRETLLGLTIGLAAITAMCAYFLFRSVLR